ncbi:MAG: DUF350 domain-containing protein [Thermodesulfobacteriota bacterium]
MDLSVLSSGASLLGAFFLLFFIGKLVNDIVHRSYNLTVELVEHDNPAMGLAMAGYYLGLVLAIGGAVTGPSAGLVQDLTDIAIYGTASIVLVNLSWLVADRVILRTFSITKELVQDHNLGTGAVVAGYCVASGLIIHGAVEGEGGSLITVGVYWLLGQICLLIAERVYCLIIGYDVHAEIEKDNIAAGVSFCGAMAGMGIIIGLAGTGDFTSWQDNLPEYLGYAALGLVLLPLIRFVADRVLLPTVSLCDEIAGQEKANLGAAFIEAFSYIAAAFIIFWCV